MRGRCARSGLSATVIGKKWLGRSPAAKGYHFRVRGAVRAPGPNILFLLQGNDSFYRHRTSVIVHYVVEMERNVQ